MEFQLLLPMVILIIVITYILLLCGTALTIVACKWFRGDRSEGSLTPGVEANIDMTNTETPIAYYAIDDRASMIVKRSPHASSKLSIDSDVTLVNTLSYSADFKPYSSAAFKTDAPYAMTMGSKKLDQESWLTVDGDYRRFYDARWTLLDEKQDEVVQYIKTLPAVSVASEEVLTLVTDFLTARYPGYFKFTGGWSGKSSVRNNLIRDTVAIKKPHTEHPLVLAARLASEDFNILWRDPQSGKHLL